MKPKINILKIRGFDGVKLPRLHTILCINEETLEQNRIFYNKKRDEFEFIPKGRVVNNEIKIISYETI